MFDCSAILTFSHTYCIPICAFLVPANLLTTLVTLVMTGLRRPLAQFWQVIVLANLLAVIMLLHVFTWFIVGVVMLPTYVLLSLGTVCLTINFWAVGHPASLTYWLVSLYQLLTHRPLKPENL